MTRRRVRRWLTQTVLWGLVAVAVVLVMLRIMVAQVPAYAAEIRAWVETETRLTFEFDSMDARLRWYGPEIVLRNSRLLEPAGNQALLMAREARIALDVWSLFRTGTLVAGRLQFVEPSLTIVRLPDGRIRLLGQAERPADRPPFDLDRLPAGRVVIIGANVEFRDLETGRGPWRLTDLDLELERAQDAVRAAGSADLPADMGKRIEFDGKIAGTLMDPSTLHGQFDAEAEEVSWSGWTSLLPVTVARIEQGSGELDATIAFAAGTVQQLKLDVVANGLQLQLPARNLPGVETVVFTRTATTLDPASPGKPVVEQSFVERPATGYVRRIGFDRLAARLRLRRDGTGWAFRAAELEFVPTSGRKSTSVMHGDISGRYSGNLRSTYALRLDASGLRLQELWPLALAFAPHAADRWLGFAPRGEVRSLSIDVARERAGATPRFRLSADVEDLTTAPTARIPGVRGLTATLSGTDERGRIAIRAHQAALQWPRMFRDRISVDTLHGDLDWRRDGRTWIVAGRGLALESPELHSRGDLEIRYVSPTVSPEIALEADVRLNDVTTVPRFLPAGRLKPRSLAWLDDAFTGGSIEGHVSLHGPMRKFPFRHGEGEFVATARVHDISLSYFPGFAPLTQGQGTVTFRNQGLKGEFVSGRVGDLALNRASVEIADVKAAVVQVDGSASSDVAAAIAYLQESPLGPRLGKLFAQLSGSGPADYDVRLSLPTQDRTARDYTVRAHFHSATLSLDALRAPIEQLTGTLELHNLQARADDLRGTFLGGAVTASVSPDPAAGAGAAGFNVRASGQVDGSRLPSFIGLPGGIGMQGATGWTLALRAARRSPGDDWTTRLAVTSDLVGLAIDAPRPFAKVASEVRDSRVRIEFSASGRNDVVIDSGPARAQLAFMQRDSRWQLDRGIARFDGGAIPAALKPGLQVLGDWPEFDLGEWLALRAPAATRGQLSDWLGPVDVRLDDVRVFGYELKDVRARLADDGSNWLVDVVCPMAEGRIAVPLVAGTSNPIVLDMRRLELRSAAAAARTASASAADPRQMPAVTASIEDFTWEGRHFGRLTADIQRDPDGLRFTSLRTESPHFSLVGSGSWLADGRATRTNLELDFDSKDLAAAARALGYRESIESEHTHVHAKLNWPGRPASEALRTMNGTMQVDVGRGRLRNVEPGAAGRVLGLMSVVELPRRLALDFRDVTDEGLAFDSVRGDFDIRTGNAYTENLLLKGAAVDIGIAGRTGLASQDYDQTVVVSGNPSGALTVAGALAAGPVIGAGVLVLSQLFKGQLQGLTRAYYRVTGPWSDPVVQRVTAAASESLASQAAAAVE